MFLLKPGRVAIAQIAELVTIRPDEGLTPDVLLSCSGSTGMGASRPLFTPVYLPFVTSLRRILLKPRISEPCFDRQTGCDFW
jgi:hypothetical protein